MWTGYNSKTLTQLKDALWEYIQPDAEEVLEIDSREDLDQPGMLDLVLEVWEFYLERATTVFEPPEGPISEWPTYYQKRYEKSGGGEKYETRINRKWSNN